MNPAKKALFSTLVFVIAAASGVAQSLETEFAGSAPGDSEHSEAETQSLAQAADDQTQTPGDQTQTPDDQTQTPGDQTQTPDDQAQAAAEDAVTAPGGFAAIEMGMDLTRVKELLKRDPQFNFRGDPDVSLLASPNESLIETEGMTFIDRAYFQFYEGRLYTIIIALNQDRLDHYTMYTKLLDQYGEPDSLDPTEVVWEFEDIRMVLERPLSVKYIDTLVFNEILRQDAQIESLGALSRGRFLDQF